ncbi:MAG: hypothetical protein H7A24_04945 [Leptospiraceae bacterium]|nr:hypothetical protein [Leptospiraceae bacterium]MCP5511203.1 hypothetical protein [Leptospiraceae bacterium]
MKHILSFFLIISLFFLIDCRTKEIRELNPNDELEKELQAEPEPIREIKHSEKTGSIYIEPYSIYPMV